MKILSAHLPIWLDGKTSRERISSEFTEKTLKMLVEKGLVKWRPVGIIQEGLRKGQPTKRLYFTADLLAYLNSKPVFLGADVGGNEMSSKWSSRDRAGRSRYQLAKGFQIIERSKDKGFSYDFISRQRILEKDGTISVGRIPKVMKRIDNRDDAIKEGYRLMVEINEKKEIATVTGRANCPTYAEYLPIFLKWKEAKNNIRHFAIIEIGLKKIGREWFDDLKLDEITQKTAEDYRDDLRGKVLDPTISAKIGYLNQLLKKAKKDGHNVELIDRYDLGLEPQEIRTEFMTPEMEEVIWPLLKKYQPLQDLADFILKSAMRPCNMIQLKWDDVHWDDGIAFVDKSIHKNKHEDGEYILTDDILDMLRRRRSENGSSNLVFVREEFNNSKPVTETWIQRKWIEVKREANEILEKRGSDLRIPDSLRFYDLKATCLSRFAEKGATEFQLQAIANHADPHTLKRYIRKKALQNKVRELMNGTNGVSVGVI